MTGILFDEQAVRRAVGMANTQTAALIELGLSPQANNFRRLRQACERYGLPVPRRAPAQEPLKRRRASKFGDETTLRLAVESARSMSAAIKALGAATTSKNYDALIRACERYGIQPPPHRGKPYEPGARNVSTASQLFREQLEIAPDSTLRSAAEAATSLSNMLAMMQTPVSQANIQRLREELSARAIPLPSRKQSYNRIPDRDFFGAGSRRNGRHLKDRLIRDNLIPHTECALCGLGRAWNGAALELQLDHISGDNTDNRLENLRFLCPNCHSQTETFCKPKYQLAA